MDKVAYIVRGLPGSGKTTLALKLTSEDLIFEADQFFMEDGEYKFDPSKLKDAHEWCQNRVRSAMKAGKSPLAISNTSVKAWEYAPYIEAAKENGYEVVEIVVKSNFQTDHKVPQQTLDRMKQNFEFSY